MKSFLKTSVASLLGLVLLGIEASACGHACRPNPVSPPQRSPVQTDDGNDLDLLLDKRFVSTTVRPSKGSVSRVPARQERSIPSKRIVIPTTNRFPNVP